MNLKALIINKVSTGVTETPLTCWHLQVFKVKPLMGSLTCSCHKRTCPQEHAAFPLVHTGRQTSVLMDLHI